MLSACEREYQDGEMEVGVGKEAGRGAPSMFCSWAIAGTPGAAMSRIKVAGGAYSLPRGTKVVEVRRRKGVRTRKNKVRQTDGWRW